MVAICGASEILSAQEEEEEDKGGEDIEEEEVEREGEGATRGHVGLFVVGRL